MPQRRLAAHEARYHVVIAIPVHTATAVRHANLVMLAIRD